MDRWLDGWLKVEDEVCDLSKFWVRTRWSSWLIQSQGERWLTYRILDGFINDWIGRVNGWYRWIDDGWIEQWMIEWIDIIGRINDWMDKWLDGVRTRWSSCLMKFMINIKSRGALIDLHNYWEGFKKGLINDWIGLDGSMIKWMDELMIRRLDYWMD
jgi:hypothetical protein